MPIQVSTSVCIDLKKLLESRCNNGRVGRSLQSDSLSQHLAKRYLVVPRERESGPIFAVCSIHSPNVVQGTDLSGVHVYHAQVSRPLSRFKLLHLADKM